MRISKIKYKYFKRGFDIVVSSAGIIILLPVFIIIGLAIYAEDRSSPVFIQERIGINGKTFKCIKFRSMKKDCPGYMTQEMMKRYKDRYITVTGKIIRRCSADEIPQLFNVLSGSMSIVGPRPVIKQDRGLLKARRENGTWKIKPGITGLAQVCGRDRLSDMEKAELDRIYAESMSFEADLRIMLCTFKRLLTENMNNEKVKAP